MTGSEDLQSIGKAQNDEGLLSLRLSAAREIIYASDVSTATLGTPMQDFHGSCIDDWIHAETADEDYKELLSCSERARPWQGNICFRRTDGSPVWLNTSVVAAAEDGGRQGSFWYATPVTSQGEMEPAERTGSLDDVSLRTRLIAFAAVLLSVLGVLGFWILAGTEQATAVFESESQLLVETADTARGAQLHFKKQVQEWKNVLIRGHNTADYEKYWTSFRSEEAIVATKLERLAGLMTRLGLDPKPAQDSLAEMAALGLSYRNALESFDAVADAPHRAVDQAVRGIDRAPMETLDALTAQVLAEASQRLHRRIDDETGAIRVASLIGGTIIVAILALAFALVGRYLFRNVEILRRAVLTISKGNYTKPISFHRRDEFGSIARGIKTLQTTLAVETRRIAEAALQGQKLTHALEGADAGLMLLDEDHTVSFVNRALRGLFAKHESEIASELPNFQASKVLGSSIGATLCNDNEEQECLGHLVATGNRFLQFGSVSFETHSDPILDDSGERIGTLITWRDTTLEMHVSERVQDIVNAAKEGDLAGRVDIVEGDQFLHRLGAEINELVSVSESAINDAVRVLASISSGDLTQQVVKDYRGAFSLLKENANSTAHNLTALISQLKGAAAEIKDSSQEVEQGNDDLSSRTQRQSVALEQIVRSTDELTATIEQNTVSANEASALTMSAAKHAEDGCIVVTRAVGAMDQINESSQTISNIVGVIDEIAFQTNLLALNAAVEAARAGEQGRGFAVVANEVRTLAQRSATAAREIKTLIVDSVDKVGIGMDLVTDTGEVLAEMMSSVRQVVDIVGKISDASQQQLSGIQEVGRAISEMDEMTQENADLVIRLSTAGRKTRERASGIRESLSFFKTSADTEARTATQTSLSRAANEKI